MDELALKDFVAVYEQKSMTRAAEKRFSQPSSLMRHINALEDELGRKLFIRKSSGCIPTSDGDFFYRQITPVLQELQDIHDHFIKTDVIRICMPATHFLPLIDTFCSRYMAEHKNVRFEYVPALVSDWIKLVFEGIADCALLADEAIPQLKSMGLSFASAGARDVVCLLSKTHPLADRRALSARMLMGYDVYINDYSNIKRLLRENSVRFSLMPADSTLSSIINTCHKQGIVITVTPFNTQFPNLTQIPLEGAPPFNCVWGYAKKSARLTDFFAFSQSVNPAI